MKDDETGWVEADITINGQRLSFAESMTVRVAVTSFQMYVSDQDNKTSLGAVVDGYAHHLDAVVKKLLNITSEQTCRFSSNGYTCTLPMGHLGGHNDESGRG